MRPAKTVKHPGCHAAMPAFGPLRRVGMSDTRPWEAGNRWRGVAWDQAGGAFGAAAVPRPAGSSFMPLRRTRHRLGPATWLECPIPVSVGSGLVLRHCKRELARGPYGNVAIQDLTPAPGAPHTKDPASRQAGPGGGDLWGAEEHSGRAVCAFSARPLHHEPAPGPACRDARQRHGNPTTESGKRPAATGRTQTLGDATRQQAQPTITSAPPWHC